MNKKIKIIKINGLKGITLALFALGCVVAGFLIFPGWICMNIWNFISSYFYQMPEMNLVHGSMLWCIVALTFYALNKDNFSISLGQAAPMPANDEKIKQILRQISEQNAEFIKNKLDNELNIECSDVDIEENNDKIIK